MKKFDPRNYFRSLIVEAGEEMENAQPANPPVQQSQQPTQASSSDAFRSLQGQTIAGVQYAPNGSTGGTIKIKVKNSYIPFTISWVNQQITITDLQGNSIVLSDNQQ